MAQIAQVWNVVIEKTVEKKGSPVLNLTIYNQKQGMKFSE